ncbi:MULTISPECIES: SPOR domain-containing protein [Thiorhodovibrio]|uniref:SPOR domain-containing protein n=1 Tax=Thiorhodovibrio TaxID=61593 RepID=UPI0019135CE1|nr:MULTISPECIES: SPOR domain-containing protein [Thiorhodovibrio]
MARTTTRSSPSSRKRDRPQSTGAFWFLLGALVGAFGMGLAWMRDARIPQPATQAPVAEAPKPKPTFDFFETLPQEEVLVPVEEAAAPQAPRPTPKPAEKAASTAPKPASTPPPAAAAKYQLQLGSFRDRADAERRKAELALQGLSVNIVAADVGGAKTYRLRTSTFDKAGADALGKKLQAQGVSSMAIRAD